MTRGIELPGGTFAENLRVAREAHGWTKGELAQRAGVDIAAVSRLEASLRQPTLPTVLALAGALGMTASELLYGL